MQQQRSTLKCTHTAVQRSKARHTAGQRRNSTVHSATARHTAGKARAAQRALAQAGHTACARSAQAGLRCRTVQHTAVQRRNSSVHSAAARHTASKAWAAQGRHRQPKGRAQAGHSCAQAGPRQPKGRRRGIAQGTRRAQAGAQGAQHTEVHSHCSTAQQKLGTSKCTHTAVQRSKSSAHCRTAQEEFSKLSHSSAHCTQRPGSPKAGRAQAGHRQGTIRAQAGVQAVHRHGRRPLGLDQKHACAQQQVTTLSQLALTHTHNTLASRAVLL